VNIETKEQSKQWMHTHSSHKPKKFKKRLPEADRNCFMGEKRSADS
jgi:hypothetical protein